MRDNLVPGTTIYQKRRRRGRLLAKKEVRESLPDPHLARRYRPVEEAKFVIREIVGLRYVQTKELV